MLTLDETIDYLVVKHGIVEIADRLRAYFAANEEDKELEELMLGVVKKAKESVSNSDYSFSDFSHDQSVSPVQNGYRTEQTRPVVQR